MSDRETKENKGQEKPKKWTECFKGKTHTVAIKNSQLKRRKIIGKQLYSISTLTMKFNRVKQKWK